MIKSIGTDGKASVKFTLDPLVGAQNASVCGEWNGWSADADIMSRDSLGGFNLTIDLEPGRTYRFRYLLDRGRWENDWDADAYVPNVFGGDDSLLDLTALVDEAAPAGTPHATVKAAAKKTVADKQATTAKKATPIKKAPPANARPKRPG